MTIAPDDLDADVWWSRFNEALGAGLSEHDAVVFATNEIDIGQLRKLVEQNVSPDLIAQIVT